MTASQMRIAETIDAFYGDAGAKDGVSRSYKQAVEDLDAETIKALDGPYRYGIDNTRSLTFFSGTLVVQFANFLSPMIGRQSWSPSLDFAPTLRT